MYWDVKVVKPLSDYRIYVEVEDGRKGIFDVKPYLDLPVFQELQDQDYFFRAGICLGAVTWPHEQDIAPENLIAEMVPVDEADLHDLTLDSGNSPCYNDPSSLCFRATTEAAMSRLAKHEIAELTVPERIQLIEDLWNSILEVPEAMQLDDEQKLELDRRLDRVREDPAEGSSWKQVRDRIRKRTCRSNS
jgi:putative addiction module component (TIGR02574 family)